MMRLLRLNLLFVLLILGACAKKLGKGSEKEAQRQNRNHARIDPNIQRFFNAQKADCEGRCHPAVAKIVVYDRGLLNFCTGVLIKEDVLLTSSNCLTRNLQFPNVSCVNNIFAVFPAANGKTQIQAMCDKVISSNMLEENSDPALWRNDFAFLKLKDPVSRRPVEISNDGIEEDGSYHLWKMDLKNDYRAGMIREKCVPLFGSYANPFATSRFSPMATMRDCSFNEGNLGAPLINDRGEVAGVLSSKMDAGLSIYINAHDILAEEMAPIQHVSNLACAELPLDGEQGRVLNRECSKEIDVALLDRYRSRLLNDRSVHRENMERIEDELEVPIKYFQWDVKFFANKNGSALEAHVERPKCFFNIDSWIGEFQGWRGIYTYGAIQFSHHNYQLKTKLNRLLKPVSVVENEGQKNYKVEFNPAQAAFNGRTSVRVESFLFGRSSVNNFEKISDACGAGS